MPDLFVPPQMFPGYGYPSKGTVPRVLRVPGHIQPPFGPLVALAVNISVIVYRNVSDVMLAMSSVLNMRRAALNYRQSKVQL